MATAAPDGPTSFKSEHTSEQVTENTVEEYMLNRRVGDAAIARLEVSQRQFSEEMRNRMEAIEHSMQKLIELLQKEGSSSQIQQ